MLVLIAFAALVITIGKLWNELVPLRAENKRLKEERGTLVIDDPTKLQAIKVPARFAGEDRYTYRIFVPKRKTCNAFVHVNEIPKEGYLDVKYRPRQHSVLGESHGQLFAHLEEGEHILSIRVVRFAEKHADVQLIRGDGDVMIDARANTRKDRWPSVQRIPYTIFDDGVGREMTQADQSGRLVLLRYRIQAASEEPIHTSYATVEPEYQLDGMMLWLETE